MNASITRFGAGVILAAVYITFALCGLTFLPDPASGAPIVLAVLAPFPVTPALQGIALAYRNAKLIADEVLPRVPVSLEAFKYLSFPIGSFMTITETRVGRKGRPNTVEFTADELTSQTFDEALDDEIPVTDINNAANQPGMPDPVMRATEGLTELVALKREVRAAALVFDPAVYAAANKVQLAGNDQWSAVHANSDPVEDITVGLDACVMRPTVMVIGRLAWTKLSMHPKICAAVFQQGTTAGIATRKNVADLFELDEILVGEGWLNTAKKGQAAVMQRVWGKHCALVHRNKQADTQRGTTFGYTAQWGTRVAGQQTDPNIGMRGGERVRVGESVRELITANDLGYFIQDAIA